MQIHFATEQASCGTRWSPKRNNEHNIEMVYLLLVYRSRYTLGWLCIMCARTKSTLAGNMCVDGMCNFDLFMWRVHMKDHRSHTHTQTPKKLLAEQHTKKTSLISTHSLALTHAAHLKATSQKFQQFTKWSVAWLFCFPSTTTLIIYFGYISVCKRSLSCRYWCWCWYTCNLVFSEPFSLELVSSVVFICHSIII